MKYSSEDFRKLEMACENAELRFPYSIALVAARIAARVVEDGLIEKTLSVFDIDNKAEVHMAAAVREKLTGDKP